MCIKSKKGFWRKLFKLNINTDITIDICNFIVYNIIKVKLIQVIVRKSYDMRTFLLPFMKGRT